MSNYDYYDDYKDDQPLGCCGFIVWIIIGWCIVEFIKWLI
jgi:hypothetical protein